MKKTIIPRNIKTYLIEAFSTANRYDFTRFFAVNKPEIMLKEMSLNRTGKEEKTSFYEELEFIKKYIIENAVKLEDLKTLNIMPGSEAGEYFFTYGIDGPEKMIGYIKIRQVQPISQLFHKS